MQYGTKRLDDTFQFPATDNDLVDARSCNVECQQLHTNFSILQWRKVANNGTCPSNRAV